MDSIDPAKIPPPILEKTVITQKPQEREPQEEHPGYQAKKKAGAASKERTEAEEDKEANLIDILV
ncbi:MAG: hypothetical protein QME75_02735 [Deltaproteobacteria bacterium]|nr:hypothetical protein [Deltaproteobacteria bacterium]